jgi:hypothetical protein
MVYKLEICDMGGRFLELGDLWAQYCQGSSFTNKALEMWGRGIGVLLTG